MNHFHYLLSFALLASYCYLSLFILFLCFFLLPFSSHVVSLRSSLLSDQSNEEARVEQLAAVASSLPIENFRLAAYLFAFLYQVASHSEKNKMGHANLATVTSSRKGGTFTFSDSFLSPFS